MKSKLKLEWTFDVSKPDTKTTICFVSVVVLIIIILCLILGNFAIHFNK
jgi:hypothetical protein